MNRRLQSWAFVAVLAAMVAGFALLYHLRLGQGDDFPAFSTFRADPPGLRALRDSLGELPGVRVTAWLKPIAQLPPTPARTLVMAGVTKGEWTHFSAEEFSALDAAVRNGCRLVIAINAPPPEPEQPVFFPQAKDRKPSRKMASQAPAVKVGPRVRESKPENETETSQHTVDLGKWWGVEIRERAFTGKVRRTAGLSNVLPEELPWSSNIFFRPEQGVGWDTLYWSGDAMILERPLGKGTIVLAGDAYLLTNEALQLDRATPLLVELVGKMPRVEFIESHLGVTENPGVATLARRYGLAPAILTLLIVAGFFAWSRMASFAPPLKVSPGVTLEYHPAAGLEALMRRAVPPNDLIRTCAAEWRATARPGDIARAESALAKSNPRGTPTETYNSIVLALRRR